MKNNEINYRVNEFDLFGFSASGAPELCYTFRNTSRANSFLINRSCANPLTGWCFSIAMDQQL